MCFSLRSCIASAQLAHNPGDVVAFKRAIGAPRRGIGAQTVTAIETFATARKLPVLVAAQRIVSGETAKGVNPGAVKALGPFVHAVLTLRSASIDPAIKLSDVLNKVLLDMKFSEYIQVRPCLVVGCCILLFQDGC